MNKYRFAIEDYRLMGEYYEDSLCKKISYVRKKWEYQKKYHFAHLEFFEFNLAKKEEIEIQAFWPRKCQAELYHQLNDERYRSLSLDKYASYTKLKKYYKRDCCAYNPSPNEFVSPIYDSYLWKEDVIRFLSEHDSFIIKPLDGDSGKRIQIVKDVKAIPTEYLDYLVSTYSSGFILEELISQSDIMAQFHPLSVNTVRINTFNNGVDVEIKYPCMRIGCGDSVVDNAHNGGVYSAIDAEEGITCVACNWKAQRIENHPDTNIPLIGFEVPMWEELCETAKCVALEVPGLRICGMDFAFSKNGWQLIEINCYPHIIYQIATQVGIKSEVDNFTRTLK